jgi:hypothetical protein
MTRGFVTMIDIGACDCFLRGVAGAVPPCITVAPICPQQCIRSPAIGGP